MELKEQLLQAVDACAEQAVDWRRLFHANPETAFREHKTAQLICSELEKLDIPFRSGIAGTGIVAHLKGGATGGNARSILFRADIDALPIREATGLDFSADNGNMHACGHDGHIAIALTVARCLNDLRRRLKGDVYIVFQPAEEIGQGAKAMVDDGLLSTINSQRALSLHIANMVEYGTVCINDGLIFAAASMFSVELKGKGGHAASPQELADPILAAAHAIAALQSVVSRNVDPQEMAVLTIGSINGGHAGNVVPDKVLLKGTARAFSDAVMERIMRRAQEVISATVKAFGVEAEFTTDSMVPAVVNDPAVSDSLRKVCEAIVGSDGITTFPPQGYGDDVSEFINRLPGCYFLVGAGPARFPHHNSKFDFDERAVPLGAKIVGSAIIDFLS